MDKIKDKKYKDPENMINIDGSKEYAYVTVVMGEDKYIPGAIVLSESIRKLGSLADLVVIITNKISKEGIETYLDLVREAETEKNKGKLKIVYGVGGNNTLDVGEKFKKIPAGVDGILSVSPYYNKPTQQGIIQHFTYLSSCTDLPIILYNVPGRTGSNMAPSTTLKLAELTNVVAVKEASGNMEQIMEIIRLRPAGFGVLSGDDALTMPLIAAGADGVISVVANAFPKLFGDMVHASMEESLPGARKAHYELMHVTKLFFEEGNPGGVKVSLAEQGIMTETMRLPLVPVSDELRNRIQAETKRILSL
jgi:4-hydroxy-tetrahydrodipicolinate synthase